MTTATATTSKMHHTALVQWYGSNRMLAEHVGRELRGCNWVCVPFAGGMSEVRCITARTILVNDLHWHVMNLAAVAADPVRGPKLYRRLRRLPFHPEVLERAQNRCKLRNQRDATGLYGGEAQVELGDQLDWAVDYFVCAWMTRSGSAGTPSEFTAGLSTRYEAGGGDSSVRFHNAARSLVAWRRVLSRCNFASEDAFGLLAKCKDEAGCGYYIDAPWPDKGKSYEHKFTDEQQERLARVMQGFRQSRVVIRYGDHPLIRELYPQDDWIWKRLSGRTQTNEASNEVLILNGPSRAGEVA